VSGSVDFVPRSRGSDVATQQSLRPRAPAARSAMNTIATDLSLVPVVMLVICQDLGAREAQIDQPGPVESRNCASTVS